MSKITAAREALKKSLGFVSKVDEAAQALPRTKGTGAEFMKELEKQPGVKKAEIADRRLDKIKAMPKMTKEEFIKQIEEHPAPQLKEKVRSFDNEEEIERLAREKFLKENYYTGSLRQEGIQKWRSSNHLFKESYRQDIVNSEAGMALEPKYQNYTLPGGENYREVLIKLPARKSLAENYQTSHFPEDENVLAHVRVSDRWGPNDENVLHIEEIQSDWHQEGRKKGYRSDHKKTDWDDPAYVEARNRSMELLNEFNSNNHRPDIQAQIEPLLREAQKAEREIVDRNNKIGQLVPDAPFKKNWHELVMKRMLNYAAENGYDKVVITPGIEQAKRYDLIKHIDTLTYHPEKKRLVAFDSNLNKVLERTDVSPEQIPDFVGKDVAQRLIESPRAESTGHHSITGLDLQIGGGEGMKGFYDKILPDYLNNFGKQYGATVQEMKLPTPPKVSSDVAGFPMGEEYMQGRATWDEFLSANPDANEKFYTPVHSFDITPQMREDIKKGLPLYQAAPAIPAIPAAESLIPEQTEEGMKKGGRVKVSANEDTMFLEMADKKFKRK